MSTPPKENARRSNKAIRHNNTYNTGSARIMLNMFNSESQVALIVFCVRNINLFVNGLGHRANECCESYFAAKYFLNCF